MTIRKFFYGCGIILLMAAMGSYYFLKDHPHLVLKKTTFNVLPNWEKDDFLQAFKTFQQSCVEIAKRPADADFGQSPLSGKNRDWQTICVAANHLQHPDLISARHFFETWFAPYQVKNNFTPQGLFTGYYLPLLQGRLKRDKEYSVPIYAIPRDLITIDLSAFHPKLVKKPIVAQLKNQKLLPYPDRAAIARGAIEKNAPILMWSNNILDVFFAQIQGSALVQLPHEQRLLGYAGNNGRSYTAIGNVLIRNKVLTKQTVSMQTIRAWLLSHPKQQESILDQNASYVFFRWLNLQSPLGAEQVPLTPQRSLAIDPHYISFGTPIWLDTRVSFPHVEKLQRLMIAQDQGGAIKGAVRGDVYWGAGEKAALIAGKMHEAGRYWILLPKISQPS